MPGRVALGGDADAVAIDDQIRAGDFDRVGEGAVHAVEAREVGIGVGAAEVVDGDDAQGVAAAAFLMRTQDAAADAAVAVDGDADANGGLLDGVANAMV